MDQDNILDVPETNQSLFSQVAQNHLLSSSKWALFLSILGILLITLLISVFVFIGSTFMGLIQEEVMDSGIGSGLMAFILILYLIIIGLPTWFLFQFSIKTKKAIQTQDPILLESGLRYHKLFFTFYGVIAAFFIGLNLLATIGLFFA